MSYFISPPDDTNWKMRPDDFKNHLLAMWPNVLIRDLPTSEAFSFMWNICMRAGEVEGQFFQDGEGVVLDGDLGDCAAFAVWFRSLVPPKQKLWFYDEPFIAHVDLTSETSAASIVATMRELWRGR